MAPYAHSNNQYHNTFWIHSLPLKALGHDKCLISNKFNHAVTPHCLCVSKHSPAQAFQSDGTLTTYYFGSLCIATNDVHYKRNDYILIRAHVNPIPARGIQEIQFFVTPRLECCVYTVNKQCQEKRYEMLDFRPFHFNLQDGYGVLTIKYTEPEMWNICLRSSKMVSMSVTQ